MKLHRFGPASKSDQRAVSPPFCGQSRLSSPHFGPSGLPSEFGHWVASPKAAGMRHKGTWFRYDRRFDVANINLDGQVSRVAGIDRYAIAVRIGQLEIVVTKKLVLSNRVH